MLRRLVCRKNLLNNLILFADCEQEDFSEIQIITLTQYAKELALDQLLYTTEYNSLDPLNINEQVDYIVQTQYAYMYEFVLIESNLIRIGINKTEVTDLTIDYALGLLLKVENFDPGNHIKFGNKVRILC